MAYQQQYNRAQYAPVRRQQESAQAATVKANTNNLVAMLSKPAQQEQFRRALGNMIPVERFVRVCQTALRQTPKLASSTPESFMSALMQCAQLGLEPNTPQGLAYLVPYSNRQTNTTECQIQIGYKGLLELMWRSGMVESINADVVYRQEIEQGLFEYESGMRVVLRHKINLLDDVRSGDDADIVAAYACATLKSGQVVVRVLTRKELDQARRMGSSGSSPWRDHYKSMALKTAIRRLASWVPTTPASEAIAIEDSYARQTEITGEVVQEKPQKPVVQIVDAATAAIPQAPQQQIEAEPVEQPQQAHEPAKRGRRPKQQMLADQQAAMQAQQAQQQAQPVQDMAYQQAPAETVASEPQQPEEDDPYFTHIKKDIIWPACLQAKVSPGSVITAFRETHGNGCSWDDAILALCEDETDLSVLHQHIQLVKDNPGRYVADPDEDNFF